MELSSASPYLSMMQFLSTMAIFLCLLLSTKASQGIHIVVTWVMKKHAFWSVDANVSRLRAARSYYNESFYDLQLSSCYFVLQAVAACNGRLSAHHRKPFPGLEAETVVTRPEALCHWRGEVNLLQNVLFPESIKWFCHPTILASHGGIYECYLLGCDAVDFGRQVPSYRKNQEPLYSG